MTASVDTSMVSDSADPLLPRLLPPRLETTLGGAVTRENTAAEPTRFDSLQLHSGQIADHVMGCINSIRLPNGSYAYTRSYPSSGSSSEMRWPAAAIRSASPRTSSTMKAGWALVAGWNGASTPRCTLRSPSSNLRGYDDVHLAATLAAADDNLVIATGDADAAAVGPVEPCDRGVMLLGTSVRSLER